MRGSALFAVLLFGLAACAQVGGPQVPLTSLGETPAQPSSDQVVVALQARLDREPLMVCPGLSLAASCEWIEQGDQGALFPPEKTIRVASPVPLAGLELDAKPNTWEICYRLEGSDTLYLTRLSAQDLGMKTHSAARQQAGLFEPYYPTVRVYRLGEPGYNTIAHRCDGALSNRGQNASAW
ncbi:MAG: hypothetical protein Kilf2KO_44850 [Rhodospirillales bacterium]